MSETAPDKSATGRHIQFPLVFGVMACVANLPGIASGQIHPGGELSAAILKVLHAPHQEDTILNWQYCEGV